MNLARAKGIRRVVKLAELKTVFYEYPGASKDAQTIIMIHGYRGNHRGLEAIAAALNRFRVLIPDLPGFGESEELDHTHTIEAYAIWLKMFVESQSITELNIVGHSFGTLVVGAFAEKNPANKIVLINPVSAPALSGPRGFLTSLTRMYYRIAELLPEPIGSFILKNRLAVQVMSSVMAKTKNRNLRLWIHQQHLENFSEFGSVRVATEGYRASISTNISNFAKNISSPVLLIAATLDDITGIEIQRHIVKTFKQGVLREILDVGHLVHYEAPDQAALLIELFMENKK
jgi:pimeloyl-ACP methyl ester carboxylesterase